MLPLLLAAICPPQQLPAVRFQPGESLVYKLDVAGLLTDIGTFEVRVESPPAVEKRASVQLSARAKTKGFMATNVGRYDVYATALIARDLTPLRYREDVDENDVHHAAELVFPEQDGKLVVKATKNGEPTPYTLDAEPEVREMLSTLYLLRAMPVDQPACLEVFAARKIWKVTG